jgi:VWFA-related protein
MLRLKAAFNKGMQKLSEETGGRAYPNPGNPAQVFAEIENDLRSMYVLGFVPPEETRDGKYHQLEVTVSGRDARVRARKGYTIPASPN